MLDVEQEKAKTSWNPTPPGLSPHCKKPGQADPSTTYVLILQMWPQLPDRKMVAVLLLPSKTDVFFYFDLLSAETIKARGLWDTWFQFLKSINLTR